jgi:flavin reductase (DIM6/NTAB) family NADH-FMN oxidoreductase RutF
MQLLQNRRATINFLDRTHLDMVEYAGSHPGTAKLEDPRFAHETIASLPVLTSAFAALILKIDATQVYHGYVNFTARIEQRLVDDAALTGGQFDPEAIVPVGFAGDKGAKVYRVPGEVLRPGNFA